MKPDDTEHELLRLARELDEGRAVDWGHTTDPDLLAGIEGLRDIEALAAAMDREPPPIARPEPREWLEPGSRLGPYPIEREAGRGGMGVVYLARDPVLDRPVALKLLPPDMARSTQRLARFTHEAKLLASLNHPNVATIHGLEEATGIRFLVMEWVDGETLAARLQRGAMPWREALEVCGQIAHAVGAAHAGGVVHRDLKPSNVMIGAHGRVKVLDFGLARRGATSDATATGSAIQGTWGYVSPERLTGDDDHRGDVFAFGCVLYECLSGAPAFPGASVDELREALLHREPDPSRLPADVPPAIRRLITSCVAKDPSRRLGSMAEASRAIEAALGGRATRPARTPAVAVAPHRLPEETDAFVGREDELGELAAKLRRGARVVTLRATGGMGKTRLAVRYGWRSLEEWPGGVWFCDLTDAKSRDGVAAAVAESLGVSLGAGDPVARLGHVIAGRGRCLLVLDNFEQIVAAANDTVAPWLERAREAQFLVTSREPLGLAPEEVQSLEPLTLESGVELFLERARSHRPGFELLRGDVDAVHELVRSVEAMPLAIELAAARIRVMSPGQIVERMRERFRLLAGSGGGRHGTLRAAIDGSWDLLAPWERAAFAQCAVFEGGFTLAAAESVLDLTTWNDAPWIPDVVQSLVDQSLLRTSVPERETGRTEQEVRFTMFVSLQEYARAKLSEDGATGARTTEERHGAWYARHGSEGAIAALNRPGGPERWRALARDLDNLVAACRRAQARGDGGIAAAVCAAAWEVFQLRGPFATGRELARQVLAMPLEDQDRRRALTTLGFAEWRLGLAGEALVHLESALDLHRRANDRRMAGTVLGFLGALDSDLGRLDEGRARLEAALALHREVGNRRREGIEIARLAVIDHAQGRSEDARARNEMALLIAREVGDRTFEGQMLSHLSVVANDLGRFTESRHHLEQALAIAREVGNRRLEGLLFHNLGGLDTNENRLQEGRAHYEASLAIAREVGDRTAEGLVLVGLAALQFDKGDLVDAESLYEESLVIYQEVGNRRLEGDLLGRLSQLRIEQGRVDEASAGLARGEQILRDTGHRLELGVLLCVRAELERRSGNLAAAQATLDEVDGIAVETRAEPTSDLVRQISKVREALARP